MHASVPRFPTTRLKYTANKRQFRELFTSNTFFQKMLLHMNDSLNHHLLAVYLSRVVGNLGTLACIIATLYTTLCVEYILPYFSYMFDVP